MSLEPGGKISGVIGDAATSQPVSGQFLNIYRAETGEYFPFRPLTNAAGEYVTTGLPAGNYHLLYGGSEDYLFQWNGNVTFNPEAMPVAVTAGNTTPKC